MSVKCATFLLGPQNRLTSQQRSQHAIPPLMPKDARCIAKAQDLCWQKFLRLRFAGQADPLLPLGDRANYKIYNQRTFVSALRINIDFELLLDRTRDILDYAFICKHFTSKWRHKYVDLTDLETQPVKQADL